MIWLAYAGIIVVGIGHLLLMIGLIAYLDHVRDVAENFRFRDESCYSFSTYTEEKCGRFMLQALRFLEARQAAIYPIIIWGAIAIGSGMVLFIISYLRPAWFRRISSNTAKQS
jgi:hypothetical protein